MLCVVHLIQAMNTHSKSVNLEKMQECVSISQKTILARYFVKEIHAESHIFVARKANESHFQLRDGVSWFADK
jgi:hypothetical protein